MNTLIKIAYFIGFYLLTFGLIYFAMMWYIAPFFQNLHGSIWGIDILRGIGVLVLGVMYIVYIVSLILSISSCFMATKEGQVCQLSAFGKYRKWGANQSGLIFLGMPKFMITIKAFDLKAKEFSVENESIQVHDKDGNQFNIVIDGKGQHVPGDTYKMSLADFDEKKLKDIYKSVATAWFAEHRYSNVEAAKADRCKILDELQMMIPFLAYQMYGVKTPNIQLISLETSKEQLEQQNRNAAMLEGIRAREAGDQMNAENFTRMVIKHIETVKEKTGETLDWNTAAKQILDIDSSVQKFLIQGNGRAFIGDDHHDILSGGGGGGKKRKKK